MDSTPSSAGIAGSLTTTLRSPRVYRVPRILTANNAHGITDAREHGDALTRLGIARPLLRENLPRSFLGEDRCPVIYTPVQLYLVSVHSMLAAPSHPTSSDG